MLGPIFNREALTVPRHSKHYMARVAYLGLLLICGVTFWQTLYGWGQSVSLGDVARFGTIFFQILAYLQLIVVLFFSSLFAAGAVAQEKDRRTFVLLLMTDLKNYELVLGKLFGSLMNIGILLLVSMPLVALCVLMGGISFRQVVEVMLVLGGSAIAAGSLGCVMALWRERTFQTLALTVLGMVLYLLVVEGLPLLGWMIPGIKDSVENLRHMLNPFRLLSDIVVPPVQAELQNNSWIYFGVMVAIAVFLNVLGVMMLRVWNPSNERMIRPEDIIDESEEEIAAANRNKHAAPGRLRAVWENPIIWREVRTRAYGRKMFVIKLVYLLVAAAMIWSSMVSLPPAQQASRFQVAQAIVPIFVLAFLLLNAQAVTSITSERDLNSLELLLVTDLSAKEFIFGKLGGVLWNSKEILLPPLLYFFWLAIAGYFPVKAFIFILLTVMVIVAFISVLGVHTPLRWVNTRLSTALSLGTIFFIFVGTFLCIYLIIIGGQIEFQFLNFIFFLAVAMGGFYFVLSADQPSVALSMAAWMCPLGMFYSITNIIVGNVRTGGAGDILLPFVVMVGCFGFTILAMMIPLLSEFVVAIGASIPQEEEGGQRKITTEATT